MNMLQDCNKIKKSRTFLKNFLFDNCSVFEGFSEEQKAKAIEYARSYDVEYLTEIAMAEVGGYDYVDADGYDFSDYSDSKTATVVHNGVTVYGSPRQVVIIPNVDTKIGALRIVVYNPYTENTDFFFIPAQELCYLMENDGNKSRESGPKMRIRTTWSIKNGYNGWNQYQQSSFVALAKAK